MYLTMNDSNLHCIRDATYIRISGYISDAMKNLPVPFPITLAKDRFTTELFLSRDSEIHEIVTGEIHPELADQARKEWGLENNIYNLGHRGYVANLTTFKDLAEYHFLISKTEQFMDILQQADLILFSESMIYNLIFYSISVQTAD